MKSAENTEDDEEMSIQVIVAKPQPVVQTKVVKEKPKSVETEEVEKEDVEESGNDDKIPPPPPYDKYINESWFPSNVAYTQEDIVPTLFNNINDDHVFDFRDILACIADIHK